MDDIPLRFAVPRKGLRPTLVENTEPGYDSVTKSIDISGQLKVLKELTAETRNPDGTHSIMLQHILPTTVEFIERVNSVYPVDLVISITYSTDAATVKLLRSKGYNILVPPDIDYMLNSLWKDVVALLSKSSHPTVLQEVGGYFADWTAELAKAPNFRGCVEDTKNGLWRYQVADKKAPLAVPVLSMADTALKRVEDSLIGDACVYSLEKVMRSQLACIIDGVRCGIVGWGNIGKSAAAAFKGRNAIVAVYDINPIVNMLAFGRGYYPLPLAQLLSESDIIIGCSGRRSIRVADLDDIKEGALLCSASSKDIEFDLIGFKNLCDVQDVTPSGPQACSTEKYTVKASGKSFYILDHGTPIDFLDMPLQGSILDCTCSELFVCMRELAGGQRKPGIIELTDNLQIVVAKKWLQIQTETFGTPVAANDKSFSFPASWDWP